MALDINGYNDIFKSFVDFAQAKGNVDKGKSILDATPTFSGRKITTVTIDVAKNDSVHNWTRGSDKREVNDRTRKLFKDAVADMFGG